MKKTLYILTIGLIISLTGCGSTTTTAVSPTQVPPTEVTAPVIVPEPVIVAPVPAPVATPDPAPKAVVKKAVAPPAPKPSPVVATKWVVTNTLSGSGMKTASFAITGSTRITWEVTSAAVPAIKDIPLDSFNYFIKDSQGLPYAVDVTFAHRSGVGKGTTYLKASPGKYTLYADSANCEWKITVEQLK